MAKISFIYSTMAAGKTLDLLKTAFNYEENNKKVLILTSDKDIRHKTPGLIKSRIGLEKQGVPYSSKTDIHKEYIKFVAKYNKCDCILVDEAQFLTHKQVKWLCSIADIMDVPVYCYGLKTRYTGELFNGSIHLLALVDEIKEIPSICSCGKNAIMTAMYINGIAIKKDGKDIIDTEESRNNGVEYKPLCRECWIKNDLIKKGK